MPSGAELRRAGALRQGGCGSFAPTCSLGPETINTSQGEKMQRSSEPTWQPCRFGCRETFYFPNALLFTSEYFARGWFAGSPSSRGGTPRSSLGLWECSGTSLSFSLPTKSCIRDSSQVPKTLNHAGETRALTRASTSRLEIHKQFYRFEFYRP